MRVNAAGIEALIVELYNISTSNLRSWGGWQGWQRCSFNSPTGGNAAVLLNFQAPSTDWSFTRCLCDPACQGPEIALLSLSMSNMRCSPFMM